MLGLVAVVLCVTVILSPVGLVLLGYARRLFTLSLKLVLPRGMSHPFEEGGKAVHEGTLKARKKLGAAVPDRKPAHKRGRDVVRRARKRVPIVS